MKYVNTIIIKMQKLNCELKTAVFFIFLKLRCTWHTECGAAYPALPLTWEGFQEHRPVVSAASIVSDQRHVKPGREREGAGLSPGSPGVTNPTLLVAVSDVHGPIIFWPRIL